jgi:DNA-binding transcriptional regulator YdaS (Cro superfamily)
MQGMKLCEHLKRVGKTPKQFAAEIGVSMQTVHRYIDGTRLPRLTRMPVIEAATRGEVTLADFLDVAQPRRRRKADHDDEQAAA